MGNEEYAMWAELGDKFFRLFNELGSRLIAEGIEKLTEATTEEDDERSLKEGDDVVISGTSGIMIGTVKLYPNGELFIDVAR